MPPRLAILTRTIVSQRPNDWRRGSVVLAQKRGGYGYFVQLEDHSDTIQGVPADALQFITSPP